MRIIAGSARSLPLKTIEGMDTRPTTDRIKETLFNILNPDISGCDFLDLFAGSGQIGLEAISRGARQAVFVENNKKAVNCIQENIAFTRFTEQSTVMHMDAVSAIRRMEGKHIFDIIFMDPPYKKGLEEDVLRTLADSSIINEDTLIIVEASLDTDFSYLKEIGYQITKEKRYKNNMHVFMRHVR
ncbi:16S rRNA (guanine(966)-N(2))-methyltransferase RsmD [Roseburia sp. 499]|uniref:16S rRNA (guanine(966)-N(2))-methyltransferase RsmD n=1 Tax=Roseburia sp. 499 TaxID=1261634 RepID=UPI000951200F|nr:16S rRNA (guanine(966)-N(2))-methyltransferase RsmD [Roseburia sp. 499]WVK71359.1 16S rRNA (guanine(966)-N(2))-methyltransferase RsmD [Roseburia sp. 499]